MIRRRTAPAAVFGLLVVVLAAAPIARAQTVPLSAVAAASAQAWLEGLTAPPGNAPAQVTATISDGRVEFRRAGSGIYRSMSVPGSSMIAIAAEVRRGLAQAQYSHAAAMGALQLRTVHTPKSIMLSAKVRR